MPASPSSFAIAFCSALALAAACAGCARHTDGSAPPAPSASTSNSPSPQPSASIDAAANPGAADTSVDPLQSSDVVKAKSIGHTSFVLKLTLASGQVAGWKPRSRLPLGDRRYRGEIAASRLGAALALLNVPRVEPRSFAAASLRAVLPDFDAKALPDDDGRVRGAIWSWNPNYEIVPLEQPSARAGWEPWLTDARTPVPSNQRALARALSTLVAFDYVTGNWDRWSGGNAARDSATGTLLYVDNDGAFYDPPPADSLATQLGFLRRVVRFSRSFVGMLRAIDEAKLHVIFGDEAPGEPLLSDRVIAEVDQRRKTVLEVVDRGLKQAGDAGDAVTFDFD
jgi:hypothetical protein